MGVRRLGMELEVFENTKGRVTYICQIERRGIPLPPSKRADWQGAMRLLTEMLFELSQSNTETMDREHKARATASQDHPKSTFASFADPKRESVTR